MTRVLIFLPLMLFLTACGPKNLRPSGCIVPSAILVARPLPELDGDTWRAVADYAVRVADHAALREADVATVRGLCHPAGE